MKFGLILIITVAIITGVYIATQGEPTDTNTANDATTVNESTNAASDTESTNTGTETDANTEASVMYDYAGTLTDVTGGNSSGTAEATFTGTMYHLRATFENLPDPSGTDFYEGWIVRGSSVISTGRVEKVNGVYTNTYTSDTDRTDHTRYVLTIEPDDGDPAPAGHVVEGDLTK